MMPEEDSRLSRSEWRKHVRGIILADLGGAVKGKQWPLTCYGPFKDKPCLPHLYDYSFEEIRFQCYEAKLQNNFQQFHVQFNNQVTEATQHMQKFLERHTEIIGVAMKLYDTNDTNATTKNAFGSTNTTSSIFEKSSWPNAATNSSGGGGGGNLFGGNAQPTTNSNNLFMPSNTGFSSGGSMFGGLNSFAPNNNTNNNQNPFQQQQNVTAAQPTTTSLFGNNVNTNNNTNLFSQPTNAFQSGAPSGGSNIFQQSFQQQAAGAVNNNPFAQSNQMQAAANNNGGNSTGFGIFAQAAQKLAIEKPTLFGQPTTITPNPFQQTVEPQQAISNTNVFGQPLQQNAMTGNLFGQQQQPNMGSNIFAQQQPAPNVNLFAQNQSVEPPTGLFGQTAKKMQMQEALPNVGPFGSNNNAGDNMFAQAANNTNMFQQQQQGFGTNNGNVFQQQSQQLEQQQGNFNANNGNMFQQSTNNQNTTQNLSVYSRLEDLTQDEIEAFSAARFEIGKLPFCPPPRELVTLF